MLFSKDGRFLDVTDKSHIDCLKAKGWQVVVEKIEKPKTKATKKAVEETE